MKLVKPTIPPAFILLLTLVFSSHLAAATADDYDEQFDVGAGGTLTINSDAGPIEVNSWDQNRVRARIRNADDFDVSIEQSGNDVLVLAESERRGIFGFGRGSNIRFNVDVPESYNVDLDTGGGSIVVAPLIGDVIADTSGGRIEVGRTVGRVDVDTSGGTIEIDDVDGDVRADTSGGNITIGNVIGNVEADTSGGRIRIGNVSEDVYADTSGGSIEIGNVGGDMEADTSGGNITVGQGSGSVQLDTSGGTIRADWAVGPIVADTSGGNIYLAGSDTRVEADTSGGNIEIEGSNGPVDADTSGGSITIREAVGPIRADTAGGRIDAELSAVSGRRDGSIELETAGGDITLRIPSNHNATIVANLEVTRRARDDYRIYTDFPLSIREDDDGNILGRGDINGGGDRIYLETTNSDINIVSVEN